MNDVYKAIVGVTADLAAEGISKSRRNTTQGFSFRGIDDVYNALAPLLAHHKLCILPQVVSRTCETMATQKGGTMFRVVVEVKFTFVGEDGSQAVVSTIGEAMDTGDKATNKAMSAAYKYAAFMTFAIPTEGQGHDADEATPPPVVVDDPAWATERDRFTAKLAELGHTLEEIDADRAKVGKAPCRTIGTGGRVVIIRAMLPPKAPPTPEPPGSDG